MITTAPHLPVVGQDLLPGGQLHAAANAIGCLLLITLSIPFFVLVGVAATIVRQSTRPQEPHPEEQATRAPKQKRRTARAQTHTQLNHTIVQRANKMAVPNEAPLLPPNLAERPSVQAAPVPAAPAHSGASITAEKLPPLPAQLLAVQQQSASDMPRIDSAGPSPGTPTRPLLPGKGLSASSPRMNTTTSYSGAAATKAGALATQQSGPNDSFANGAKRPYSTNGTTTSFFDRAMDGNGASKRLTRGEGSKSIKKIKAVSHRQPDMLT